MYTLPLLSAKNELDAEFDFAANKFARNISQYFICPQQWNAKNRRFDKFFHKKRLKD